MEVDVEKISNIFQGDKQNNLYIFTWNCHNGYTWFSSARSQKFLNLFQQEDGVEQAVEDGFLEAKDAQVVRELVASGSKKVPRMESVISFWEDGGRSWHKIIINNCFDESGTCTDYLVNIVNLDQMTELFSRIASQKDYDELTSIYIADKFYREVSRMIMEHTEHQFVLIRLDFDRFKIINDLFGTIAGDEILKYVAQGLRRSGENRELFKYCRVISDVFAICMSYTNMNEVIGLVKEMDRWIERYPVECRLTPNYGIYQIADRDISVSIMLDYAKMACRSVKGNIIKNYAVYVEELREKVVQEIEIERDMELALREGQFKLFLQPKYDISTGRIIGAEALCRWQHPKKGLIPPTVFIPLFEHNGFVVKLDRYMWEETCKVIRKWLNEGREVHPISLNVSRMHAYDDSFEQDILELVERYRIPAKMLELELTESAYLSQEDGIYKTMSHLKEKGLLFSVDDFGTGYSSLNMLKSIPVDIVKLDREFLNETVNSTKGRTIIRNMIALANELNIRVIAEGVESVEQAALLLEMGCELAQGYYYSKPLSVEDFEHRAFGGRSAIKIEGQIHSVIGEKERFWEEMKFLQGGASGKMEQKLLDNPYELRKNLVQKIKKYRKILLGVSDIFYEFDIKGHKSVAYFQNKGYESKMRVGDYENFYQEVMQNVASEYEAYVGKMLHIDVMREGFRKGKETLDISYRVTNVLSDESAFVRNLYILIGNEEGELQEILLCIQKIQEEMSVIQTLAQHTS